MKQVVLRGGAAVVEEVPAPMIEPGTLLVAVDHSCISVGTEMSGLRSGGMPLWKRAMRQPENVRRVVDSVLANGPARTWQLVRGKVEGGAPTGYSVAGTVLEVGAGVEDLQAGDRVACAGAAYAHHAEIVRVPRNLTVPVPEGLDLASASTVTLGAIAMQGVRRASPTLGETFVVVGLGVLGQLTCQLLRAAGCRVIGADLAADRVALALAHGADLGLDPADPDGEGQVARLTDGIGADGVIITAATPSDAVLGQAFKMCRKKGRVVLVGDVGLNIARADIYQKELDFFISTSYGPGRYDRQYEERGLDYPVGYVRWTENRNMGEYLRLLAEGRVRIDHLVAETLPLEEAPAAYAALEVPRAGPVLTLLRYRGGADPAVRRVPVTPRAAARPGQVRLAVVGAGGFAKGMHLPNLKAQGERFALRAVVSRTGPNAVATARQYGAAYATTDLDAVLGDPEVDAVLLATRHDLHAPMVLKALAAGKHVLVEKPLCLRPGELREIEAWFAAREEGATPILLTGFNRRFSRYGAALRTLAATRSSPLLFTYRMNAGHIPLDSWVHGAEGGGRNIGEACHLYDLATSIVGRRFVGVQVSPVVPTTAHYTAHDNFVATISFEDGSVASVAYTALGHRAYPKETAELFVDGKVAALQDYRALKVEGHRLPAIATRRAEKGQAEELEAFGRAIQQGGPWPIPLWEQVQAMEIAFAVESRLEGLR